MSDIHSLGNKGNIIFFAFQDSRNECNWDYGVLLARPHMNKKILQHIDYVACSVEDFNLGP